MVYIFVEVNYYNMRGKLKKIFTENLTARQRQYEALRVLAFSDRSYEEIAEDFGYTAQSLRNFESLALRGKIDFFPDVKKGPKEPRLSAKTVKKVIDLRKKNHSIFDINQILFDEENTVVSSSSVHRILANAGFGKLSRRTDIQRGVSQKNALISDRAGNLDFRKLKPFKIDCPLAGIFFFIPYILESGVIDVVNQCALPGSRDIGSVQAALSMLFFKLIGGERLSHFSSYDQEPALGIFAGLNVLPKSAYMLTYSCRTSEMVLQDMQRKIVSTFKQKYPDIYKSEFINLDFHSIPHYGDESQMEKVWCGARGKTLKGANTLLAQDGNSNVVLYTKADILRKNETQEIKNFVKYWKNITGKLEETLVFDCKLTTYNVLGELDSEKPKVTFITLRKRNKKLLQDTAQIPDSDWQKVRLPIPKRKHQKFNVHENEVHLKDCAKPFRQIIIKDHGRQKPTFVITNNKDLKLIDVLEIYAKRWHIENKISELVAFFNLNALSSPIMIRIHFDMFWTIIADTLYHLLAQDLPRFEKCQAKTLFKKFINFSGQMEFDGKKFIIKIRKRAHTPILLGVDKLIEPFKVPWLNNLPLEIQWTA